MVTEFMQVYLLIALGLLSIVFIIVKIYSNRLKEENYKLSSKLELMLVEGDKLLEENRVLRETYNQEVAAKFAAQQNEALALQKCEAFLIKLGET